MPFSTPASEALAGVENGKYDISLNQPKGQAGEQLDVSQPYTARQLVIPFQKDNPAFESSVNNALQRIKDDGRMAALEQRWLKGAQEAVIQPAPAALAPAPAR